VARESGAAAPPVILIGAHHKTGTKWMATTFRALAKRLDRSYFNGYEHAAPQDIDIFVQANSLFSPFYLTHLGEAPRGWRGIHLIRDPRDVIISGCFYHQKSKEQWLHRPSEEFAGRTYQEAINDIASIEDQLAFEMEHKAKETILHMMAWDYAQPGFLELRYEDLIGDESMRKFTRIFEHLSLQPAEIEIALRVLYNHSIFGAKGAKRGADVHLRSGDARQWPHYFTPRLVNRFKQLFPDALIKLGYENNNEWSADVHAGAGAGA
jgi:hypothetical protein